MTIIIRRISYSILVVTVFISVACCVNVTEEDTEDSNRELREFDQGWRAVEVFHEADLGWVPREGIQDPDQIIPKRRRLRKRKRRPQIVENSNEEVQFTRRRIRPYQLDPWEDINQEDIKPQTRRRLPEPYLLPEENTEHNSTHNNEDDHNKENLFETSIFIEEKFEPPVVTPNSLMNLKNLLKQSEGKLSLSEVLQQKNLSLAELLNGSEKAISALTEKSEQPTVPLFESTTELTTRYKRPSAGLRKTPTRNSQENKTLKILSEKDKLEAQRKRLSVLQPKENKVYANIIKFDVVTEATTEKRIFIPSRSKYPERNNEVALKTKGIEMETTTEQKSVSTVKAIDTQITSLSTKMKEVTEKPITTNATHKETKLRPKLPATNAKLRSTTKKILEKPVDDIVKPMTINIDEVSGFKPQNSEPNEKKTEWPMRVSLDLEAMFDRKNKETLLLDAKHIYNEPELTTSISDNQNETYVTAKEEIMEVMKDPESRDKLSKILELRNMTVEELVEQRERGSSQRHLADIFHNNTREPEPKEEPHVGLISTAFLSNILTTNRQQKSSKFSEISNVSSTTAALLSNKETIISQQTEIFPITEKFQNNKPLDTFPWKQLYPDLFVESKETDPIDSRETLHELIETIDESRFTKNFPEDGFFINLPSGVKSALFVSLAIVALSIVVFLAILVIFKWLQKKTRTVNYCSSLTTKLRPPILQGRPTTAIRTFMNETLGRKKKYYNSSLQTQHNLPRVKFLGTNEQ